MVFSDAGTPSLQRDYHYRSVRVSKPQTTSLAVITAGLFLEVPSAHVLKSFLPPLVRIEATRMRDILSTFSRASLSLGATSERRVNFATKLRPVERYLPYSCVCRETCELEGKILGRPLARVYSGSRGRKKSTLSVA